MGTDYYIKLHQTMFLDREISIFDLKSIDFSTLVLIHDWKDQNAMNFLTNWPIRISQLGHA